MSNTTPSRTLFSFSPGPQPIKPLSEEEKITTRYGIDEKVVLSQHQLRNSFARRNKLHHQAAAGTSHQPGSYSPPSYMNQALRSASRSRSKSPSHTPRGGRTAATSTDDASTTEYGNGWCRVFAKLTNGHSTNFEMACEHPDPGVLKLALCEAEGIKDASSVKLRIMSATKDKNSDCQHYVVILTKKVGPKYSWTAKTSQEELHHVNQERKKAEAAAARKQKKKKRASKQDKEGTSPEENDDDEETERIRQEEIKRQKEEEEDENAPRGMWQEYFRAMYEPEED